MIKILLLFSIISFVQMNSCNEKSVSSNTISNESVIKKNINYEETSSGKFLKISELNKLKPESGTFEIKGFVAKIYTCPPCPPDAKCKPCMRDNIVVSEENKILDSYNLTDKEITVFPNKAESFSTGKQYQFTIKITEAKTTSANLNDIELIDSNKITNQ